MHILFFLILTFFLCNPKEKDYNKPSILKINNQANFKKIELSVDYITYIKSKSGNSEINIKILVPRNYIIPNGTIYNWQIKSDNNEISKIFSKLKGNLKIKGEGAEEIIIINRTNFGIKYYKNPLNFSVELKKDNKIIATENKSIEPVIMTKR